MDENKNKKGFTLYHGVLFGARGMFKGYVRNRAVTTYEIRTLAMDMEQIYGAYRHPKKKTKRGSNIRESKHGRGGGEENGRTDLLITLENVKPPPNERLASLRRFIVFEQGARPVRILDRVRRSREQTRRREIGLSLVFGGW